MKPIQTSYPLYKVKVAFSKPLSMIKMLSFYLLYFQWFTKARISKAVIIRRNHCIAL
jgi:hypothetical protein